MHKVGLHTDCYLSLDAPPHSIAVQFVHFPALYFGTTGLVAVCWFHGKCVQVTFLEANATLPLYWLQLCICSGEFRLRLRQLEKELLQALNEVRGKILDNDQ